MSAISRDDLYTTICSEKTLQSNEKGFFMQFVDGVIAEAGEKWIRENFGSLKSDRERIRIIYDYNPVKTAVCNTLLYVQEIYRQKSAEISQARRRIAEELFKKGESRKSLAVYSQSVLRAPLTGQDLSIEAGNSLALAHWGRSEVLMDLHDYNSALIDVQAALKENLNETYKGEAYKRMGICYKAIGDKNRATVAFSVAQKLLQTDLKRVMEGIYKQADVETKKELPSVTDKIHPKYPKVSAKIYVKQAKGLGRFAAAQEYIRTGDTLVVEEPYAACLLPECFGTHCHHCFQRLKAPVGCPTCCSIAFCNAECRDLAVNTYHKYECKYLDLLIGSGMSILAHTALRMITQKTLEEILRIYDNRDLERVYGLCTNVEFRKPEDFFQRTLMAAFLLRCLQKCGYFPTRRNPDNCDPTDDELKVAELLLLHLQILQFNAHEILETKRTPSHRFKALRTTSIGVAMYPSASLFNHSCYPGVTRHFVGKSIVLKAIRPFNPGEMVPENYGPMFTRSNLCQRQKSLSARYWFTCQCIACFQDWPSLNTGLDNVQRKIRCPTQRCTFYFVLPLAEDNLKCPRCKKNISLTENIAKLQNCEAQLQEGAQMFEREDSEKGIRLLTEAIETFHEVCVPPHRDVHLGQELLRTFLADFGNVFVCPQ